MFDLPLWLVILCAPVIALIALLGLILWLLALATVIVTIVVGVLRLWDRVRRSR